MGSRCDTRPSRRGSLCWPVCAFRAQENAGRRRGSCSWVACRLCVPRSSPFPHLRDRRRYLRVGLSFGCSGARNEMTLPRLDESVRSARRATKPTEEDFRMAQLLGARVAKAGEGRVRRVVMIGSRATGYARADSDLDLVAIVELCPTARPWNGSDAD